MRDGLVFDNLYLIWLYSKVKKIPNELKLDLYVCVLSYLQVM